jgi:Zn ribbon nucleic-acid-binding protein
MFDRTVCRVDLGLCERHNCIHFTCPSCGAKHDRGYVNGVDRFECTKCGYGGFGLHPDREIDLELFAEWKTNNDLHRAYGISEVPIGTDPLNGPG